MSKRASQAPKSLGADNSSELASPGVVADSVSDVTLAAATGRGSQNVF